LKIIFPKSKISYVRGWIIKLAIVLSCLVLLILSFFPEEPYVLLVTEEEYYSWIKKLLRLSSSSVDILMFDFSPPSSLKELFDLVVEARDRGVKIRVLMEGGEEWLSKNFLKRRKEIISFLAKKGISVKVDPPGETMHIKAILVDGLFSLIGSASWTYYSLNRNREMGVLVISHKFGRSFKNYFERRWKEAVSLNDTLLIRWRREGEVNITGIVRKPSLKFTRDGFPITIFILYDWKRRFRVVKKGDIGIREGDLVKVRGILNGGNIQAEKVFILRDG